MKNIYILLTLFFLFGMSSCSEEKLAGEEFGSVEGRVVSAITFKPLANVKITSSPNSSIVFTDEEGQFTVTNVKVGDYSFEAKKDLFIAKFEPVTVNANKPTNIVFELKLTTSDNKAPTAAVLGSPINNAVDQQIELNLSWTATDFDKDSLKYEINLRKDSSNDVIVYSNLTKTNFTLKGLKYSSKYYWQVSVSDGVNPAVLSAINSFTTIAFPNPRFLFVRKMNNNNVIYAADEEGNELQLTSSSVNSYRPRKNILRDKIAYISSDGSQNQIYTMNPDGSNVFKVTNFIPIAGFNLEHISFCWNMNGAQIIYPNFDKLYRINTDGSGLVELHKTPNGKFISECDWSQDGTQIVIKVNDSSGYNVEIYVIDATSGVMLYQVLSGLNGGVGGLNFSIDKQKIVYTRDVTGFQNSNYRRLDSRIFVYNKATNLSTEQDTGKSNGFNDLDVKFSPNNADFIFTNTSNDGVSINNVQKVSIEDSKTRITLFPGGSMPDWK